MIKKIVLFLLVSFLAMNALAEPDWHQSVQDGAWRDPNTWTNPSVGAGYPVDSNDYADIRDGHTVKVTVPWGDGTSTSLYVRSTYVGRWSSGHTTGDGTLEITTGTQTGILKTHWLYVGYDASLSDPNTATGTVYVGPGAELHADRKFITTGGDVMVIGTGSGFTGNLEVEGTFTSGGNGNDGDLVLGREGGTGNVALSGSGTMTLNGSLLMGSAAADGAGEFNINGSGVLTVDANCVVGLYGDYTLSVADSASMSVGGTLETGANGTLSFDIGPAGLTPISVTGAVTIGDGTSFEVSGGVVDQTYTLISGASMSVNLGSVTVNNGHTLGVNGNTLEVTLTGGGAMFPASGSSVIRKDSGVLNNVTTWFGKDGVVGDRNRVYVMAFELPTLSGGDEIDSASFDCTWNDCGSSRYAGGANFVVDLYGIDSRVSSAVAANDYYMGYFAPVAGDNPFGFTPIQDDIFADKDPVEDPNDLGTPATTDADGTLRLGCYIQGEYDGGASGGDYIFLRLNHRHDYDENYLFMTISDPRISYSVDTSGPSCPSALSAIELCVDSQIGASDIDGDCKVGVSDLAEMAEDWLAPSTKVY